MEILNNLFGVSKKQAKVWLVIRSNTQLTAAECAKLVALPRQTTYSILSGLLEKGLILKTNINGVSYFSADARFIRELIDTRKRELETYKATLHNENKETKLDIQPESPHVSVYMGNTGLTHLFESILDVYKKGKSKRFRGYGINFFSKTRGLNEYFSDFVKRRNSYGVRTNLLIANAPDDFNIIDESRKLGRDIKHLSIEPQQAGIYLVGNRVYLFSFLDNVGIMIENKAIVRFLKDAFDDHWQKS